jgi:predicted N-acyltransferase
MAAEVTARFHTSLAEIDPAAWDALVADDNPFVAHAFLAGLEHHGCLLEEYGWTPHHLGLYRQDELIAAAPLYLKTNSHGEYVFDWAWASAYARHGIDYYPKLLCAVPYSPVTGPRLLVGNADNANALRSAALEALDIETRRLGLSSAHLNFAAPADADALAAQPEWLPRFDWQFHWFNEGWRDFDDFLDALTPKKRKNIRQERSRVARAGVHCEIRSGNEVDASLWATLHEFYCSTFAEKGNHPALTRSFFAHLADMLGPRVLAVLAWRGRELIAAALLLRGADTLYGRYWGCREQVAGLHFEACYYQGIDYCLRHGLRRFEPGAQGEHKLARGFLPVATRSFHYVVDKRFRAAIREALLRESAALLGYREELMAHSPYAKRGAEAA